MYALGLIVALTTFSFAAAEIAGSDGIGGLPKTLVEAVHDFFAPGVHEHEDDQVDSHLEEGSFLDADQDSLTLSNETVSNQTDYHALFNAELGEDEERVHAGGEVKVRKKRFLCKRCAPSFSYGYGGGGGCCGSCGRCGGGYARPVRIRVAVPVAVPVYSGYSGYGGYGGGCGGCYAPRPSCGVCGR